ncbi:MAG TPA: VOC family protein [Solirubrobacteraceae bacterium]
MIDVRSSFPILYVASVAASLGFYRDLLGFRVVYTFPAGDDPGFASLCLSESGDKIGLSANSYDPGHGLPIRGVDARSVELCLEVPDVDAATRALRAAGVAILEEPKDRPWGERVAFVADPDGNPVHLRAPILA